MKTNSIDAVVVSLCGGLGNQLFQYAMGRSLSNRCGAPFILDLQWFSDVRNSSETTVRSYALEPFHLPVTTLVTGQPNSLSMTLSARLFRKIGGYFPRKNSNIPTYIEPRFSFDPTVLTLPAPVWLKGYWQSHRYFDDCSSLIRSDLVSSRVLNEGSERLLDQIAQCDAICIHIRRGDYVSNKHAAETHGLCGPDYYAQGVSRVTEDLANPHCFVFSDDPNWVRNHLALDCPMTVVDVNGPGDAHQDLWLMAACNHFVIANSSLSWWGAWLSSSPGKVVVAPVRWFANESIITRDLLPPDWILQ